MIHIVCIANSPNMMTIPWRTHMRLKIPPLKFESIHKMKKNITRAT